MVAHFFISCEDRLMYQGVDNIGMLKIKQKHYCNFSISEKTVKLYILTLCIAKVKFNPLIYI